MRRSHLPFCRQRERCSGLDHKHLRHRDDDVYFSLEAIAINLLPMFVTNGYQFYKAEDWQGLVAHPLAVCCGHAVALVVFSVFYSPSWNDVISAL